MQAIADLTPKSSTIADIGTDHGYLAVYFILNSMAKRVIATDKNEKPLLSAEKSVKEYGLEENIELRLGDGMKVLKKCEADTVCIAGMGGELITSILKNAQHILSETTVLILQPMNDAASLRSYIYDIGWYIENESLAKEKGHIYEVILAKKGRQEFPKEILLEIGPVLWKKKQPLLLEHIDNLLIRNSRRTEGMSSSVMARQTPKYKKTLAQVEELEEYKKCLLKTVDIT